jgi:type IV pilus assembly protein PilW
MWFCGWKKASVSHRVLYILNKKLSNYWQEKSESMSINKYTKCKQEGFTLVELLVSLSIGLVLLAGVMSVFVGMRTTSTETSSYGELQENGRFAISLLSEDLLRQNFFGDFNLPFDSPAITPPLNGLGAGLDCVGGGVGINNSTFPDSDEISQFRTLWGETSVNDGTTNMTCIDDARPNSDVIQIKRVISNPVAAAPAGRFYLVSNTTTGTIFAGGTPIPVIDNSGLWQYQHHVYYIRDEQITGSAESVPVLMKGQLTTEMAFSPVIDGIEVIHFMYGVDMTTNPNDAGYGTVDSFISAASMTNDLWDNAGGTRILAVRIYVLARNITPDRKYTNTNTYNLGDLAVAVNDNYRRLMFTSTVSLLNSGNDAW